ncbi:hypothetical protein L0Y69_01530 [bacterium]|nr:hypothetical protein [bacterium]
MEVKEPTYVGDPRGIDIHTGITPEAQKLAELSKEDQKIEGLKDMGEIGDRVDELMQKLKDDPNNPDLLNTYNRLRAKLNQNIN